MRLCLQLDDVLKDLGPKQNPDLDSDIRLIPAAKVVGEGAHLPYQDQISWGRCPMMMRSLFAMVLSVQKTAPEQMYRSAHIWQSDLHTIMA